MARFNGNFTVNLMYKIMEYLEVNTRSLYENKFYVKHTNKDKISLRKKKENVGQLHCSGI